MNFFTPNILGTISDYIMIGVTAMTAFFLYKTLKSQKEVQHTQNELFKIERIRFLESIKPKLKYSISRNQAKSSDEKKIILTMEVSNETNCEAIKISRISSLSNTQQLFTLDFDNRRDHITKGDNPLLFHFGIDSTSLGVHFIYFKLKYQDVAQTRYEQSILCIYDEKYGIEIHPSLPETIVNDEEQQLNEEK